MPPSASLAVDGSIICSSSDSGLLEFGSHTGVAESALQDHASSLPLRLWVLLAGGLSKLTASLPTLITCREP